MDTPRRVLVEVTHQMWVDVVEPGQDNVPIEVSQQQAEELVLEGLATMDWGGYSMLGKAFVRARLDPWKATRVRIAFRERRTMSKKLHDRLGVTS